MAPASRRTVGSDETVFEHQRGDTPAGGNRLRPLPGRSTPPTRKGRGFCSADRPELSEMHIGKDNRAVQERLQIWDGKNTLGGDTDHETLRPLAKLIDEQVKRTNLR